MKVIAIIPARYASTRFPGKTLALLHNKPVIQHVYEAVSAASLDLVTVATDSEKIVQCVSSFDGNFVMTADNHPSGTDRCGEAAQSLHLDDHDVIINVQGDEPFITKEVINILVRRFTDIKVNIATLIAPFDETDLNERMAAVQNPNKVKVVFDNHYKALYFSRFPIPFNRNNADHVLYYKHIGVYGYRYKTLKEIIKLPESLLEKSEKLEQLRWLENGYDIYVSECHYEGIGIDTPDDLKYAASLFH